MSHPLFATLALGCTSDRRLSSAMARIAERRARGVLTTTRGDGPQVVGLHTIA